MGVKVTMIRCDSSGRLPAERLFGSADDWDFVGEHPDKTLRIVKQTDADATASPDHAIWVTVAEFPASGIESVEFA